MIQPSITYSSLLLCHDVCPWCNGTPNMLDNTTYNQCITLQLLEGVIDHVELSSVIIMCTLQAFPSILQRAIQEAWSGWWKGETGGPMEGSEPMMYIAWSYAHAGCCIIHAALFLFAYLFAPCSCLAFISMYLFVFYCITGTCHCECNELVLHDYLC